MGNQTHGIVGISIQRQFDDSNNFFFGGISQVLILVIVLFVGRI
jgi:ABC-type spermidine/putrescine transport system permease subunit I